MWVDDIIMKFSLLQNKFAVLENLFWPEEKTINFIKERNILKRHPYHILESYYVLDLNLYLSLTPIEACLNDCQIDK